MGTPEEFVRDRGFALRLAGTPCATGAQARRLIRFARKCIRRTPLPGGLTPAAHLSATLRDALAAVGRWLADPSAGTARCGVGEAMRAAAAVAGPFAHGVTGPAAACWSVVSLCQAVSHTGRSGRGTDLGAVAPPAALAADLARRSGPDGVTPAALEYQERLYDEVFGRDGPSEAA
jgi:hypothetical protein